MQISFPCKREVFISPLFCCAVCDRVAKHDYCKPILGGPFQSSPNLIGFSRSQLQDHEERLCLLLFCQKKKGEEHELYAQPMRPMLASEKEES